MYNDMSTEDLFCTHIIIHDCDNNRISAIRFRSIRPNDHMLNKYYEWLCHISNYHPTDWSVSINCSYTVIAESF